MKRSMIVMLGFLFLFLFASTAGDFYGISGAAEAATTKQLSIVGTYMGTIWVSDADGFSSKSISVVIAKQPGKGYMFSGFLSDLTTKPIYGFVSGKDFYAYGENIELQGELVTSGKKVKSMMLIIGNTSATPSCMASGELIKK